MAIDQPRIHPLPASFGALLLAFGLCTSCAGPAGETLATPTAESPAQESGWSAALGQLLQASAPGPEMAGLSAMVGDWDVRLSVPATPGGLHKKWLQVGEGTARVQSTLEGRFLEWSTRLNWGQVALVSRTCLGFDRRRETYEMWWSSDLNSAQYMARGHGSFDGSGIFLDRVEHRDGESLRTRTILRLIDQDHFELQRFNFDQETAEWVAVRTTHLTRSTTN